MSTPAWHEQARALDALGATTGQIAAMCGVSKTTVLRALNPEYRVKQRQAAVASAARRFASDPDYRARRRAAFGASKAKARARRVEILDDVFL